jgi:hypothetical protein
MVRNRWYSVSDDISVGGAQSETNGHPMNALKATLTTTLRVHQRKDGQIGSILHHDNSLPTW